MTNWPPADRLGAQTPRVSKVPTYISTAGPECVELAEAVGLVLHPWQRYVLKHGLGERPNFTRLTLSCSSAISIGTASLRGSGTPDGFSGHRSADSVARWLGYPAVLCPL